MSGSGGGEERKVSSLRELSPAIEPARDLWPQIEARLNEERRAAPGAMGAPPRPAARAVPLRWLAAAAVVASVAVGVWIGRSLLPAARPGAGVESALSASRATPARADAPTALDVTYVSDPRYQRDRAALMPRRIWRARSAGTRAMRCCRSCWSTLTRMRCASSRTSTKPATLAGGSEHVGFQAGGRDDRAVCERGRLRLRR
jgi:hypothetical protein